MFHDVRPTDENFFPLRYSLSSFLSVSQFTYIIKNLIDKHQIIDPSLLHSRSAKPFSQAPAFLTFDDGLSDHIKHVFPILMKHNIKAFFFIPVEAIIHHKVIHSHKIQFIIGSGFPLTSIIKDIRDLTSIYLDVQHPSTDFPIFSKYCISNYPASTWSTEQIFITRFLREFGDYTFRDRILSSLFMKYVTNDEAAFAQEFYMTTDDLNTLSDAGMVLGGHGYHSLNACFESSSLMASEVNLSHSFLRSLNKESSDFQFYYSYPNGGVTKPAKEELLSLNCKGAFTTIEALANFSNCDLLEIPRFDGSKLLD